jgi:hypothetical protein
MALIEALIDFGEDENIEDDVYDNGKQEYTLLTLIFDNCQQPLRFTL